MLFLTFWPFTSKYYYYTNNLAKSCFWPVWPFMSRHKEKQREISFSDPLDMPPLKSFYRGLTKQKCFTTTCVPSSNSGDLCFLLFRFSCGVSSTRSKNNKRSISQNRLIGHAPLKSLLAIDDTWFYETKRFLDEVRAFIQLRWSLLFSFSFYFWNFFYENKLREINFSESLDMPRYIIVSPGVLQNIKVVPSSSSCDFCFLLFRFSFGVSSTRTKSSESSISQNRLICHHYKVSVPWFYKTKKIL